MAELTWFKLGGPAEFVAEPRSIEQLAALVRRCRDEAIPVRMLGGGSNVLVRGEGVAGVVIRLVSEAFGAVRSEPPYLYAGGGAVLGHVISAAVREGLGGLEHMVGIPGTVGGALHGNAGSHGTDIGQWTCRATLMTRAGEISSGSATSWSLPIGRVTSMNWSSSKPSSPWMKTTLNS